MDWDPHYPAPDVPGLVGSGPTKSFGSKVEGMERYGIDTILRGIVNIAQELLHNNFYLALYGILHNNFYLALYGILHNNFYLALYGDEAKLLLKA